MKNISIGLTVFGLALGVGLFSVSYATNLSVNEVVENAEITIDTQLDEMEAMVFGDNPKFDDDDYDHEGFEMKSEYHSQKAAIFEDNQVTQEEIDSITYTKLKEKLLEEFPTELEDGIITEDELKSGHKNHKGKGHKKGRGMHNHDDDYDHDHDDED
jgi:hypothetical protein